METYDFIDLEIKIDNAVIMIVEFFKDVKLNDINETKELIKNSLITNPNSYVDYKNKILDIISQMMSKVIVNDCKSFCSIFLTSTFLLENFIKYKYEHIMSERIGNILGELFYYFQEKIEIT